TFYQFNGDTNAYDIEFKPFEAMTKSQIFSYLLRIFNYEVSNYYYNFGTGRPSSNVGESELANLPYYSDYDAYYQNAKTFLVREYSSKGFGLSLFVWANNQAGEEADAEYVTEERAREWWQETITIGDSFASNYFNYFKSMNPDFHMNSRSDYINAFSSFIDACNKKINHYTGEYGYYAPLPKEAPYYEAYLVILKAKQADAATYAKLIEPIIFNTHYMRTVDESGDGALKVVGIARGDSGNYRFNESFIASADTIAKYAGADSIDQGVYAGFLVETNDQSAIKRLVKYCDKGLREYIDNEYNGTYWSIDEPSYEKVSNIMFTVELMMKVFLYVGLFFLAFSMLLFYTFISASISNKRREIGILRAVGARGSDVFKVFYSESFIIALINFVLASIGTIAVSLVLNYYFSNEIGFPITLLKPGVIELSFVLAATLVASFISALLPVLRIAHQKPVDAIRGK
ncbi:MAG: FtsX-like permease family protein, partial [Bacilli bacterium]|nr:FtsX-like permease family protein [Bacilli bacterium]